MEICPPSADCAGGRWRDPYLPSPLSYPAAEGEGTRGLPLTRAGRHPPGNCVSCVLKRPNKGYLSRLPHGAWKDQEQARGRTSTCVHRGPRTHLRAHAHAHAQTARPTCIRKDTGHRHAYTRVCTNSCTRVVPRGAERVRDAGWHEAVGAREVSRDQPPLLSRGIHHSRHGSPGPACDAVGVILSGWSTASFTRDCGSAGCSRRPLAPAEHGACLQAKRGQTDGRPAHVQSLCATAGRCLRKGRRQKRGNRSWTGRSRRAPEQRGASVRVHGAWGRTRSIPALPLQGHPHPRVCVYLADSPRFWSFLGGNPGASSPPSPSCRSRPGPPSSRARTRDCRR